MMIARQIPNFRNSAKLAKFWPKIQINLPRGSVYATRAMFPRRSQLDITHPDAVEITDRMKKALDQALGGPKSAVPLVFRVPCDKLVEVIECPPSPGAFGSGHLYREVVHEIYYDFAVIRICVVMNIGDELKGLRPNKNFFGIFGDVYIVTGVTFTDGATNRGECISLPKEHMKVALKSVFAFCVNKGIEYASAVYSKYPMPDPSLPGRLAERLTPLYTRVEEKFVRKKARQKDAEMKFKQHVFLFYKQKKQNKERLARVQELEREAAEVARRAELERRAAIQAQREARGAQEKPFTQPVPSHKRSRGRRTAARVVRGPDKAVKIEEAHDHTEALRLAEEKRQAEIEDRLRMVRLGDAIGRGP